MPRNESGQYVKPPGTTAVPNTTIASAPYNALQDDMADALTESLPRTGVAPMLADLPMNGNKITGLADGADAGDAVNFGQLDAKLNADASNVGDATAQAAFRHNIGADLSVPGTIAISELDTGVLPITTDLGRYITLSGHGAADFTIEGFGSDCPVGWTVTLYIPRTIADSGGTNYALGNRVRFIHTTSGAGLDLTFNKRMVGDEITPAVPSYTYDAYPDACDFSGRTAALIETLTFVHEGSGRWRLIGLPAPATGENANGRWVRWANGHSSVSHTRVITPVANTPTSVQWSYPANFVSAPVLAVAASTGAPAFQYASVGSVDASQCDVIVLRTNTTETGVSTIAEGPWK